MDIYCPQYNCLIDCISANDCNDNDIFIFTNNINNNDFSYLCSPFDDNCNSFINCDYQNGEYQQECLWTYANNEWNCHQSDECYGETEVGFLSILNSFSTIVFLVMMAFGFLVVLGIFVYSMKEKYDIWKKEKEFARKRSHREKGIKRENQRRHSMMTTNDNKKLYSLKYKLSGSYYKAPKSKRESTMNEDSEYQYEPSQTQYGEHGIIEEEESSQSLEYSMSSNSAASTKSKGSKKKRLTLKKAQKPKPIRTIASSSYSNDEKAGKSKKNKQKGSKKKKNTKSKVDTPMTSKKNNKKATSMVIQSFDEDKADEDCEDTKARAFSIESLSGKKKKKGARSARSTASKTKSSNKSNAAKKRQSNSQNKNKGDTRSQSVSDKKPKTKKKNSNKKKSSKKKSRTASKPLNVIQEDEDSAIPLSKSKTAEKFKRSKNKKKTGSKGKTKSKSVEEKKTKRKKQVHKKTSSLISLGFGSSKQAEESIEREDSISIVSSVKSFTSFIFGSTAKDTLHEEHEVKEQPSSPIFVKKVRNGHFMDFLCDIFYASNVYGGALFHAWDIASDFGVLAFWIENNEDLTLIIWSLAAIFLYRGLSALMLARQFGYQWGILQLLDLTIYVEAYRSLKNPWCVYTRFVFL